METNFYYLLLPRSIVPATGSSRKDAGKSPDPAGKHGKLLESSEKKSGNFPIGILLPTS